MKHVAIEIHEICEAFKETCIYVGEWVNEQKNVGEESITDWLLYNLSKKSKRIRYIKFNRREESAKTGADWEWWIWFDEGLWGARVQAKRLKDRRYNYTNLMKNGGDQIDKLIGDAIGENLVPLHAFYTHSISPATQCGYKNYGVGIFLSGAESVKQKCSTTKRDAIDSDDLLNISLPLLCFSCCPLISDGFGKFLNNYVETSLPQRGMQDRIPDYVTQLYEFRPLLTIMGDNDDFINQFDNRLGDVKAILIMDLRSQTQNIE